LPKTDLAEPFDRRGRLARAATGGKVLNF